MPLWERYQQCLVATDPVELALIIEQFERVMPAGVEPPSWMRAGGDHVTNQPLLTVVDPQALGAACTLRATAFMAAAEHLTEARALYQRVLARYSGRDWAYFVNQAKEVLAGLQISLQMARSWARSRPGNQPPMSHGERMGRLYSSRVARRSIASA